MEGAEFLRKTGNLARSSLERSILNTGTVNAGAAAGAGHAIDATAHMLGGVAGTALNVGLDILPTVGVVGLMCYGFRKIYDGVFGGSQRTTAA